MTRLEKTIENLEKLENAAAAILDKGPENLTSADRLRLLQFVNVAYHTSGKIEGCFSVDSCAACTFCQKMIAAGRKDPLFICAKCYAAADAWKVAAWRRHQLNARILSTVLFEIDELQILPAGLLCRYNEDGDTTNAIMARNYLRNAAAHTTTHFGYWFKNSAAVAAGLAAEGITDRADLPENIRFIQSSIRVGIPSRPVWFADAVFTVWPDAATTAAAVAEGAHECNGKKCRECGYFCYMQQRPAVPVQIAEILRCSKADRVQILQAWNDRVNK